MQVTIARLSDAYENKRLDSQFYRPEFVESVHAVLKNKYSILSEIAYISDGNHQKIADNFDSKNGVRYLCGQDLSTNMMLVDRNIVHIPESYFDTLKRSHIFKDDLLITIVGANTGLVGLVFDPPEKLVANCKLGIARVDFNKILPAYLYSFLVGRYGQHQLLRSIRGGGQTGLILPDMRELKISRFSDFFEKKISRVTIDGHSKINESTEKYENAQTTLLSELGLNNWKPKHQLSFIKNHSEVQQAERIDAEYYQPKYEDIINAIKGYTGGWDTLDNLVHIKKCTEVGSGEYIESGVPFVRISNISALELTEDKYISESLYKTLAPKEDNIPFEKSKSHQPTQGEILFSKDGTPGIAYYLSEVPQNMIPSGGILRLKNKTDRVNNEYLTLVLNSILTQEQVNRDVGGSIILHWRPDQVKETVIPILPKELQTKIQQKVSESFTLRKQSKHLLECAKKAVEMAIERDEKFAMKWLEKETSVYEK